MELREIKDKLFQMEWEIKQVLKDSGLLDFGEVDFDYDVKDPEQNLIANTVRNMLTHLESVHDAMEYMQMPVVYEGVLHKQQNGRRYECGGKELTCGCPLEVLVHDEINDTYSWEASRMESKDDSYYLVTRPNLELEGLRGRIRMKNF